MYSTTQYPIVESAIFSPAQQRIIEGEIFSIAHEIAIKTIQDMGARLIPFKSYKQVEDEALDKAIDIFRETTTVTGEYADDGSIVIRGYHIQWPEVYHQEPIYAYGSKEEYDYSWEYSTEVSSEMSSAPSSEVPSRAASPGLPATAKLSFGTSGIDFAFNIGSTNAPATCQQTVKIHLENGAFEMVVDENPVVQKKAKEFTEEELHRQAAIVEEFKKKVLG
uniref:Phage protein n=1 Tax=Caenorhabditis tropicalis TaxID=1561998 RepID=A0A1I7UTF2_9PELO